MLILIVSFVLSPGVSLKEGDSNEPAIWILSSRSKDSITLSDILKETPVVAPKSMEKDKAKDSLVYICKGIPPLPAKVGRSKGELVEFTSLLPKSASQEEEPSKEVTEKVIVLTRGNAMPKRKTIQGIKTWMELSLLYLCSSQRQETS